MNTFSCMLYILQKIKKNVEEALENIIVSSFCFSRIIESWLLEIEMKGCSAAIKPE